MRTLCESVLGIEAIVVLLATSLAASNGSVSSTTLAWTVGLALMVLLTWVFFRARRKPLATAFRRLQVLSAGYKIGRAHV